MTTQTHRHPLDHAPRVLTDIPAGPDRDAALYARHRANKAAWMANREPSPTPRPVRAVLSLFGKAR